MCLCFSTCGTHSHDIEDDSQAPAVHLLGVATSASCLEDLRGKVTRGATESLHQRVLSNKLGQAKVSHFDQRLFIITGQQDILRLNGRETNSYTHLNTVEEGLLFVEGVVEIIMFIEFIRR